MTKIRKDQEKVYPKREPLHVIRRRPAPPSPPLPPRMVSPAKLQAGIEEGAQSLRALSEAISRTLGSAKNLTEVDIPVGFDLDGHLIGIGTGAPVTIRLVVKVTPSS